MKSILLPATYTSVTRRVAQNGARAVGILLIMFSCNLSYSQKPLSQQSINELVTKTTTFLGIENNDKARSALNRYFATYNRAGASAAMASLRNDLKGREDLLRILNRATSSKEMLSATLTAMNVNPQNVPEITDYFFPGQLAQRPVTNVPAVQDSSIAKKQLPTVSPVSQPVVWTTPSKKFFDGRKAFCNSAGTSYYTVVIIKDKVLMTKYDGKPNVPGNKPTSETVKALLNGEHIVQPDGTPTDFKYENNLFFEKASDGVQWVQYVECKE